MKHYRLIPVTFETLDVCDYLLFFCHAVKDESQKSGEEVWIVEEDEEDQVCQPCQDRHKDNVVVAEDFPADGDNVGVGEIPLEDKGGHVDDKVERVEADHEVSDGRSVVAERSRDAEDVGVRQVEGRRCFC